MNMENKDCRLAKEFLAGAGVRNFTQLRSLTHDGYHGGNACWNKLSPAKQEGVLRILQIVLSKPLPKDSIGRTAFFDHPNQPTLVLNDWERKLLTYLRGVERDNLFVDVLLDLLVAHYTIRSGNTASPARLKQSFRMLISKWGARLLYFTASKVWLWNLGARLFSLGLQSLDIEVGDDYSGCIIIKTIQTRPSS